jgi:hypothetical protein
MVDILSATNRDSSLRMLGKHRGHHQVVIQQNFPKHKIKLTLTNSEVTSDKENQGFCNQSLMCFSKHIALFFNSLA